MRIYTIVLVLMALMMLVSVLGSGCSQQEKEEDGVTTVLVGTGNAYPPFAYQDDSGESIGFDKAVLDAVDDRLPQYKFKYQILEFKNILVALGSGNIDIGAHQYVPNEERRANYLFSEVSYYEENMYIAVLEETEGVESFKDLEGKAVTAPAGSIAASLVLDYNRDFAETPIEIKYFDSDMDILISNLETGTAAATLLTSNDIDRWNKLREKKLKHVGEPVIDGKVYFLFNKNNPELQQAVDEALADLKASDEYDKIVKTKVTDFYYGDE